VGSLHDVNRVPKLIVTTAACAALAISAAGCGEKQEPATTGPVVTQSTTSTTTTPQTQGSPEMTVGQFLTSRDAQKVCDELLTPAFLRKEYGGRAGCLKSRKRPNLADPAPSLRALKKNNGSLVIARPRGGLYGGQTLRFSVLRLGNTFAINALASNAPKP
jgi:hypothetical protein